MARGGTPRFSELLTLSVVARADAEATRRALHRRDREVNDATGHTHAAASPARDWVRLRDWARYVDQGRVFHRLHAGWWAVLWLGAIGAVLLGVGAALAVFRYDGTRPVNVLAVLTVFVALPLVTAGLSALGMLGVLPRLWPGQVRGLGASVLWGLAGRLPKAWAVTDTAEALRGELRRGGKVLGRAAAWAGWSVSQALALLFVLAGWVTFMGLLATSDLAFGWASTFEVDAERLRSWLLAALWFHPSVVPDAAAVERTVAERAVPFAELYQASPEAAAAFKSWWRPLSWLILAYGVVPRLALALFAGWRMRAAVGRAFDRHPAGQEVLRRMNTPLIEAGGSTRDAQNGDGQESRDANTAPVIEAAAPLADGASAQTEVIRWSAAPTPGVDETGAGAGGVRDAGGGCTLEQDQAAVREVAAAGGPVRVYVKGWEPPLAEFTDLLRALRAALGDGVSVEVVVVRRGADDRGAAAVWARRLAVLGDPWLRVSTAEQTRTSDSSGGMP